MALSYYLSVVKRGLQFVKEGKLKDCIDHAFDMMNVYRNYGKDNELQIQQKILKKMLRYANSHVKHYQEIGKTINDIEDIKQYPFIDKTIIKNNFDSFVSKDKDRMIYNIARTSGSTGSPLEFYNANGLDDFFQYNVWKKHGYENDDKILSMMGPAVDEEDVKKGIYWKQIPEYKSSHGQYHLSCLYLTNENIDTYVDYILNLKPDFIRGFPSYIYDVATYILEKNINIDFRIKGIELTSETSYDYQWERIKKAFKTDNLFFQYGHTETCVFAYSYDDTYKLRVEPLYGYVEILDEDGKHVKEGETGEVVVTSLHNFIMPFIRYRTGDMAEYGGFDGKYMILNRVLGRSYDYLVNEDGTKINFTAFLAEHHMKAIGRIEKWQFEQFEKGKAIIHIIKAKGYSQDDENEIKAFFKEKGKVDIEFDYVEEISRTTRGKTKIVIQHIDE